MKEFDCKRNWFSKVFVDVCGDAESFCIVWFLPEYLYYKSMIWVGIHSALRYDQLQAMVVVFKVGVEEISILENIMEKANEEVSHEKQVCKACTGSQPHACRQYSLIIFVSVRVGRASCSYNLCSYEVMVVLWRIEAWLLYEYQPIIGSWLDQFPATDYWIHSSKAYWVYTYPYIHISPNDVYLKKKSHGQGVYGWARG